MCGRSLEAAGDLREDAAEVRADRSHHDDCGNRDQRRNQSIFDRRHARGVGDQGPQEHATAHHYLHYRAIRLNIDSEMLPKRKKGGGNREAREPACSHSQGEIASPPLPPCGAAWLPLLASIHPSVLEDAPGTPRVPEGVIAQPFRTTILVEPALIRSSRELTPSGGMPIRIHAENAVPPRRS